VREKIWYENKGVVFCADALSREKNPKKALVYIHGFSSSKDRVIENNSIPVDDILGRGYLLVLPTIRSHFDRDTHGSYRGIIEQDDIGSDLETLMDKIKCDEFVLCGHSLGGSLALHSVINGYLEPDELILLNSPLSLKPYFKKAVGIKKIGSFLMPFGKLKSPLLRMGNLESRINDFYESVRGLWRIDLKREDLCPDVLGTRLHVVHNIDDGLVPSGNAILYSRDALENPGEMNVIRSGRFKGHTVTHNLRGKHSLNKESLIKVLDFISH